MSVEEGWRNYSEMQESIDDDHALEVEEMLWESWRLAKNEEPLIEPEDDWYRNHGQGD